MFCLVFLPFDFLLSLLFVLPLFIPRKKYINTICLLPFYSLPCPVYRLPFDNMLTLPFLVGVRAQDAISGDCSLIDQVMLFGQDERFLGAIVCLNPSAMGAAGITSQASAHPLLHLAPNTPAVLVTAHLKKNRSSYGTHLTNWSYLHAWGK